MTNDTEKNDEPRGTDDRRRSVDPAQDPAPSSPERDQDKVREGLEKLERVESH